MIAKPLEPLRTKPEDCAVGEFLPAEYVPHWDGRIRLTEFFPTALGPTEKPWIFAATYKGLDPLGWKRIE